MLTLQLALKFLFSKKREKFISINAILSIGSVALSVMVLIVVIGVMSGFGKTLREKIMTMTPHINIYANTPISNNEKITKTLKNNTNILSFTPYIFGNAVLELRAKLYGIVIRGIDIKKGEKVINLNKYITHGTINIKNEEIIIGSELSKELNISLNDEICINAPTGYISDNFPGQIYFTVKGIYESGLYDQDMKHVFINLKDAQSLYGFTEKFHGIGISVKDPEKVENVKKSLMEKLDDYLLIRTWIENNKPFFEALKTEKKVMFILLTFAVLIAAINIISTLVMLVMEKFKDIGILKAIGFTKSFILYIFLLKGLIIGFIGTIIGSISGILFIKNIDHIENFVKKYTGFEVFPSDVYYFDHIPTHLEIHDLIIIISLAIIVSIIASIYPAFKASNLAAIEALRYE